MIHITEAEFQTMSLYIREKYGVNLEKKKYLIESKLWIELAKAHATSYSEYWQKLRADGSGHMEQNMIDLLTTNYSYFLREDKHFEFIKDEAIPKLNLRGNKILRILCAGCAAGQEVYTTAMYLSDLNQMGVLKVPFEVVGIDVSAKMIRDAQKGSYGSADYARLPKRWQECYCEPLKEGSFKIRDSISCKVRFERRNLMESLTQYRNGFNIVFCRNVLIYIQEPERTVMLKNVVDTLSEGGYLLIGHTESLMQGIAGLKYLKPAIYCKEVRPACINEKSPF